MDPSQRQKTTKSWGVQYQSSMWHELRIASMKNACKCLRCRQNFNPGKADEYLKLVGFTAGPYVPPSCTPDAIGVIIKARPFCSVLYYEHITRRDLEICQTDENWPYE